MQEMQLCHWESTNKTKTVYVWKRSGQIKGGGCFSWLYGFYPERGYPHVFADFALYKSANSWWNDWRWGGTSFLPDAVCISDSEPRYDSKSISFIERWRACSITQWGKKLCEGHLTAKTCPVSRNNGIVPVNDTGYKAYGVECSWSDCAAENTVWWRKLRSWYMWHILTRGHYDDYILTGNWNWRRQK